MTATIPLCLGWLAAAIGALALPLLLVLPVTPLLDRRTTRRRLKASRAARPVTGEHATQEYMRVRALRRGVLAVAHA